MTKKRVIKWGVIGVIVLLIAGMIAYPQIKNKWKAEKDANEVVPSASKQLEKRVLNINAEVLKYQHLTDKAIVTGSTIPDEEVDLSFESSGKIVAIYFEEGTHVTKGQLLAKVNDRPLQAQLSRYEAQLKLAEDRVYRQSALLERDAVSQEAYEQARTELATLNADIDIVKSNIALTELCAPFDGIIGLRNVSEGAYASPSVVVAKLTKISPLKIDFYVPERYASQIHPGTRLSFTVEGRQERFEATVYATETQVDVTTRTLAVRARYPNARGRLLPGRFATVEIRMHEISDAIAVPTEAIVPEMGIDKVFLYRGGKAHAVEVTTGLRTESQIQIINGLQVGDTLLTSGTLQLREGLPVQLDRID